MILTVTANPAIDKAYFVDRFEMGQVHRPLRIAASAGGKGLNVSRVATILGQTVTAMGFLGGSAGEFIRTEVEKMGITTAFTPVEGETRTCINIADSTGRSGELLEPGPEVSSTAEQAFFAEFAQRLEGCRIVCVSGSLPAGLSSDFYRRIVALGREKGKPVIVDTSGKAMLEIIEEGPFMVKPNDEELAQLLGYEAKSETDIQKALVLLKEKGVTVPFVTLGGDGAMALLDGRFYRFRGPKVTVKSAVGSGDSTVAGIAVGLCEGRDMVDAIRLGLACGTANTQFDRTGYVSQELVAQYYSQITATVC